MTLSEAANRTIGLASEVRDYYSIELPKWHPAYPLIRSDEQEPPAPPAQLELRTFLESLSAEMIYKLMLIMYLGRGDFGADDLAANYESLKDDFDSPEDAASQMMAKAPLADHLSDGLEVLRERKIDVDKLPLKKAKVGKR